MKKTIKAIIFIFTFAAMAQVGLAVPPANDHWASAQQINGAQGGTFGTTVDATTQQCEPVHNFPDADPRSPAHSVWFKWVVPANGSYTFRVNAAEPTSISAYVMAPGICNGGVATIPYRLTENDVIARPGIAGGHSRITFAAAAGTAVYFSVDGYAPLQNYFTLDWEKTKYRYNAQLDTRDAGTDLIQTRDVLGKTHWWYARTNAAGGYQRHGAVVFGTVFDYKTVGDFNGDGLTDIAAVRRENGHLTWWIADYEGQIIKILSFGLDTDKPIVGDYDGDGIADIAVTRDVPNGGAKTWHILRSSDGSYYSVQFGLDNDKPMIGDYDGDGKTDVVAIRRLETEDLVWYILRSSDGSVRTRTFGLSHDLAQVVDFDLDGKTDIAVFRWMGTFDTMTDGYWYWIPSGSLDQTSIHARKFGQTNDVPQAGDYDGDGIQDLGVYRNGVWWTTRSNSNTTSAFSFGLENDAPRTDMNITRGLFLNTY